MFIFLGQCVFIQGAAATPTELINCMAEHAKCNQLKDIVVCHMHTEGKLAHVEPEFKGIYLLKNGSPLFLIFLLWRNQILRILHNVQKSTYEIIILQR